jgi:5'-deoxynucleotidase YfbR-like HD superfamily hydrolase
MERAAIMRNVHLAGRVTRYHTWPTLTQETIAEHSWGVAIIFFELFAKLAAFGGADAAAIVEWILKHDLAELWSGDMPFPVKLRYPALKAGLVSVEEDAEAALGVERPLLTDYHKDCIKICDLLQMMLYGQHEKRLGNQYADCIAEDTADAALNIAERVGVYAEVKAFITRNGEEA